MSDIRQAAESAQALSAQFQNIVKLGEHLAKIDAIDTLAQEKQKLVDAKNVAIAEAIETHNAVSAKIVEAKSELAKVQTDTAAHIESVYVEADKIIGDAHVHASGIVDEAKQLGAEIEQHFAKVKAEAVELEQRIVTAMQEHMHWEDKLVALKQHVASFFTKAAPAPEAVNDEGVKDN